MKASGIYLVAVVTTVAWTSLTGCVATAQSTPTVQGGNATVICEYSHTLADDPIVYPGRPGIAMRHDFLGSTTTTAYSTPESLRQENSTTCENAADTTAYWAPALKLPDGTVVPPMYQKTYYTNQAIPSSRHVRVQAFPYGMRILAGDHNGMLPNPSISFLCTGRGYTNTIPTDCVPNPTTGTQFNIGVAFPSCWDGRNLTPIMGSVENVVYPDNLGECPATHPIHLPSVNLSLAYKLGNITDLTEVRLSMDPTLDAQGRVIAQNWGSLYTAHADFFNGWREEAAQYMAEFCLNGGRLCNKQVPYNYSTAMADTSVRGGDTADRNYGNDLTLFTEIASDTAPESLIYMKFRIPQGAATIPPNYKPEYKLWLYGGNATNTTAGIIHAYSVSTEWAEDTLTANRAPACKGTAADLYLDNVQKYRTMTVTKAVDEAIAAGRDTIAFCVRGAAGQRVWTFNSRDTTNPPMLQLMGLNPSPY